MYLVFHLQLKIFQYCRLCFFTQMFHELTFCTWDLNKWKLFLKNPLLTKKDTVSFSWSVTWNTLLLHIKYIPEKDGFQFEFQYKLNSPWSYVCCEPNFTVLLDSLSIILSPLDLSIYFPSITPFHGQRFPWDQWTGVTVLGISIFGTFQFD